MKKLFLYFFIFFAASTKAQSIEQTLDYINENIYDHFCMICNANRSDAALVNFNDRSLAEDLHTDKYYEVWAIDRYGKLTIEYKREEFIIPKGTSYPKWVDEIPQATGKIKSIRKYKVYLKQIISDVQSETTKYSVNLTIKCAHYASCFTTSEINYGSFYEHKIYIDSEEMANKIQNAIKHLIDLAKANTEYLLNDPFEK